MSHNLHLITVNAETGADACDIALAEIAEWGTLNNYRGALRAISEDDELYINAKTDENTKELKNIKQLNLYLKDFMLEENRHDKGCWAVCCAHEKGSLRSESVCSSHWFWAAKYCLWKSEIIGFREKYGDEPVNVLVHEFHSGHYNEYGLTNFSNPEGKRWVVIIDMHS